MDFIYFFVLGKGRPQQDPPLAPLDLLGRGGSGIPENAVTKVQSKRLARSIMKCMTSDCSYPATHTQQIKDFIC